MCSTVIVQDDDRASKCPLPIVGHVHIAGWNYPICELHGSVWVEDGYTITPLERG